MTLLELVFGDQLSFFTEIIQEVTSAMLHTK